MLLAACRRGSDDTPRDWLPEILSEGAGPANEAPLERLVVGARYRVYEGGPASNIYMQHVAGTTVVDGHEATRLESPATVVYTVATDAGLYLLGSTQTGMYERPVLLVPATVRVGMSWVSDRDADGEADAVLEVTGRAEEETIFGPAVVWTITEGGAIERRYAEGFGRLSVGSEEVLSAVIPDDPQPGFPTLSDPLPLQPVGDGPLRERFQAVTLSAAQAADGSLTVTADGWSILSTADVEYARLQAGVCFGLEVSSGGAVSVSHREESFPGFRVNTTPIATCAFRFDQFGSWPASHGSAALVEGALVHNARREFFGGLPDGDPNDWSLPLLLFRQADGQPRALVTNDFNRDHYPYWLHGVDGAEHARYSHDHLPALLWHRHQPYAAEPNVHRMRVLHPPQATELGLPLAWETDQGLLLHATVPADGPPGPPRLAGFSGGNLSVRTSETAREFLITSADGAVDRIEVTHDGVHRERIASLALPRGHAAVGALRLGGFGPPEAGEVLVVATYDGVRATPRWNDPVGAGDLSLWATEIGSSEPVPVVPPPSAQVTVTPADEDAVVCWPDADQPLPRDGWTLGGAPVAGVAEVEAGCALLLRDWTATADPDRTVAGIGALPGGYRVTGHLPGIGPVRVGAPAPSAYMGLVTDWSVPSNVTDRYAPLAVGGFANISYQLAPGALAAGTPASVAELHAFPAGSHLGALVDGMYADAAGHGMWWTASAGVELAGPQRVRFDLDQTGEILGHVQGGGVVAADRFGQYVLRPDGTRTDLEAPFFWGAQVLLSDGTRCGGHGAPLTCVSPEGVEQSVPLDLDLTAGDLRFLPTGQLVVHDIDTGTYLLDPADLALALLDPRPLGTWTWDAEGRLWSWLADGSAIVEVTAEGLEEHPIPSFPERHEHRQIRGLLVDREVFVLLVDPPNTSRVSIPLRLPRP